MRYLAPVVQDMQLVLFDLPGGPSNLPDAATVAALADVGRMRDLTYTVHLLDDLRCDPRPGRPGSIAARRASVVDLTRSLAPWAWVGYLDGRAVHTAGFPAVEMAGWLAQATRAVVGGGVHRCAGIAGRRESRGLPRRLCHAGGREDGQRRVCVDVGHLWLDGRDPLPYLEEALPLPRCAPARRRPRDHASLAHTRPSILTRRTPADRCALRRRADPGLWR